MRLPELPSWCSCVPTTAEGLRRLGVTHESIVQLPLSRRTMRENEMIFHDGIWDQLCTWS